MHRAQPLIEKWASHLTNALDNKGRGLYYDPLRSQRLRITRRKRWEHLEVARVATATSILHRGIAVVTLTSVHMSRSGLFSSDSVGLTAAVLN